MDFNDTPEEAAYRAQVRTWLEANAPKTRAGGSDPEGNDTMPASRAWQATKAAAGYACITWPKEWGGQGGTPIHNVIFGQEEAHYPIPPNPYQIGLGMCVPTVMNFADAATKERFAGPAIRGEEIWCQLFSEPSGGSDVAATRTRYTIRRTDPRAGTVHVHFPRIGFVMKRADAWKVANTNVIAKNLAKKAVVKSVQHITNFR
jgi:alkylation response protein AidB-like acyl-CoA dehydrogenase